VTVLIRPGALRPAAVRPDADAVNVLAFTALGAAVRPDGVCLRLLPEGTTVAAGAEQQETTIPWPGPMPQPGERVMLSVDPERVSLLPAA
jgi:hypothetical protein